MLRGSADIIQRSVWNWDWVLKSSLRRTDIDADFEGDLDLCGRHEDCTAAAGEEISVYLWTRRLTDRVKYNRSHVLELWQKILDIIFGPLAFLRSLTSRRLQKCLLLVKS